MSESIEDEQLALLVAVTNESLTRCHAALKQAHGNADLAAQFLLTNDTIEKRGHCEICGVCDVTGRHGQGSYSGVFYCHVCWDAWEEDRVASADGLHVQPLVMTSEETAMLDRDLGLVEGITWQDVGSRLMTVTAKQRSAPLARMRGQFALEEQSWEQMAAAARVAVEFWSTRGFENAAAFLFGASEEGGPDVWRLVTMYEMQTVSLLPRRNAHSREKVRPETSALVCPSGCTGLSCASGMLGQTEEVDVDVYDYGKHDAVLHLHRTGMPHAALIYDPACSLCPIGVSVGGIAVARFTLYPRSSRVSQSAVGGLPLAAVLWELLLGARDLKNAAELLKSVFQSPSTTAATMAAGAALLLSQPGHGVVLIEWSQSSIFISPIQQEGVLVHANHCVLGSDLSDVDARSVAGILSESKERQASVEEFVVQQILDGRVPLSLKQMQQALSVQGIQNDSVLAAVIVCAAKRELHVRFRLQTSGMERVEDTVECDFWQCFSSRHVLAGRKRRWDR